MGLVSKIQNGIYYHDTISPQKFFGILFLRADRGKNSKQIGEFLGKLWGVYMDLKKGVVGDLPDHTVPAGDVDFLLGYGLSCFNIQGIKINPPTDFVRFGSFCAPAPGSQILLNSGFRYSKDIVTNPGTDDFMVQVTADSQLAIYRAIVETWKIINDASKNPTNKEIISLINFYTGFQRDDYRSWLDFHDGLSNMKSGKERLSVIAIRDIVDEEYLWAENSTYMAYLRLAIDLEVWRRLTRTQQEVLVGRDKLTGCPITSIGPNGQPQVQKGCPAPGTIDIAKGIENEKFRTVGDFLDKKLRESHIARSHHASNDFAESIGSSRIFRQGYEFLENINSSPYFRVGLNFVSFQNSPMRFTNILTREGWLGRTNFGGDPDNPINGSDKLIFVHAAGMYFVPPRIDNEAFPGCRILL